MRGLVGGPATGPGMTTIAVVLAALVLGLWYQARLTGSTFHVNILQPRAA